MTNILITHNPFMVKTEIIIDEVEISETSGLYKYINTPMQDWVGEFLPALVEHCNDDELKIIFKGLQHNYDDLEAEVERFLKENREYDIELQFEVCKSQIARLGAMDNIVDEMKNQKVVEELHQPDFISIIENAEKDELRALVLGGTDESRYELVDELLGQSNRREDAETGYAYVDDDSVDGMEKGDNIDSFQEYKVNIPFVSSKFCQMKIFELPDLNKCKNTYYRFAKKAINSEIKPIVIYLLEDDVKKNNVEMLNVVSDAYREKGKKNKWRFIFVAENPQTGKRMLRSEFAIKDAVVFAPDDIILMRKRIEEYQNEVCLVNHVRVQTKKILANLVELEGQVSKQAEMSKMSSEIDELEERALKLINSSERVCSCPYESKEVQNEEISKFISDLTEEFSDYCFCNNNWYRDVTENVREFVKGISKKIEKYLVKMEQKAEFEVAIKIHEEIMEIVEKLRCEIAVGTLKSKKDSTYNSYPLREKYLNRIDNTAVEFDATTSEFLAIPIKEIVSEFRYEVGTKKMGDDAYTLEFKFYDGLQWRLEKEIPHKRYLKEEEIISCKYFFRRVIEKLRPIFQEYFDEYVSYGKESAIIIREIELRNALKEIEEKIKLQADKLRKEAEISEKEKERLSYIQDLQKRVEELIML